MRHDRAVTFQRGSPCDADAAIAFFKSPPDA
jgi:hypothetical protein